MLSSIGMDVAVKEDQELHTLSIYVTLCYQHCIFGDINVAAKVPVDKHNIKTSTTNILDRDQYKAWFTVKNKQLNSREK
jgi:hypothetical protein